VPAYPARIRQLVTFTSTEECVVVTGAHAYLGGIEELAQELCPRTLLLLFGGSVSQVKGASL